MPSARRVRWAKIRVTAVTIAALAILSVLAYLLTGGTVFQATDTLYLYIPDATGIEKGSLVRVDGIDAGKVESVELSGSRQPERVVRLVLTIKHNRLESITSDSTAEISSETVIGDKYVDITSHRSPVHLRAGGEIQYRAPTDIMKSLDLQQFEAQLRIVEATLDDIEAGRTQVGQFVKGDQMYRDLQRRLGQLAAGIHKAINTTGAVGQVVYSDALYQQIAVPLTRLDETLARIASGPAMRDTGQYDELVRAASDFRKTIAGMRAGAFFSSDALYVDWNRNLGALIARVDEISAGPAFNSSAVYDSLNGWAREMESSVRDFREHPEKYMRLKVF